MSNHNVRVTFILLQVICIAHALINCPERLYDDNSLLTREEVSEICNEFLNYDNFIVRIRNEWDTLIKGNVFYEAMSQEFFDDKCKNFSNMCRDGFLIDIYSEDKVILIQPGEKSKNIVNMVYRTRVVETLRFDLKLSSWSQAIVKSIRLISYKYSGGKIQINRNINSDPENFLWKTFVPIISVFLVNLTLFLYYMSKGVFNSDFYDYMDKLLEFWREIESTQTHRIILHGNICIFCWQSSYNIKESFLYCNHSYHTNCMRKWRLMDFKACPCSFVPESEKDLDTPPYLMVDDLKILLGLSLEAFRRENIYDYFIDNERKIAEFNKTFNVDVEELCWIYHHNLEVYKSTRILYKLYKSFKMMCCMLAFKPKFLKNKKIKLVEKLLKVKQKKATVGKFI